MEILPSAALRRRGDSPAEGSGAVVCPCLYSCHPLTYRSPANTMRPPPGTECLRLVDCHLREKSVQRSRLLSETKVLVRFWFWFLRATDQCGLQSSDGKSEEKEKSTTTTTRVVSSTVFFLPTLGRKMKIIGERCSTAEIRTPVHNYNSGLEHVARDKRVCSVKKNERAIRENMTNFVHVRVV